MTLDDQEAVIRAAEARALLDNKLLQAAFSDVESGFIQAARNVGMTDRDLQHSIILSIQLLDQVRQAIFTHVETGEIIDFDYKQRKKGFFSRLS